MRRQAGEVADDADPEIGLFENVEQAGHWPAHDEFAFQVDQVHGLGQRHQR
jgi:hypothetical protein